uniref:ANK_REP_REGION domain-containing protein n=1 Tax=Steinernema glaseri TaxID=37863 RepID=A0A1I7Y675_9BILA
MRPLLHQAALADHHDAVRLANGRQPMRDDDRRAPLAQPTQRPLDAPLGMHVHRRGGFVQHQHRGVCQ